MTDELAPGDAQIDDVLRGRGHPADDATVLWLASAARPGPPPELLARIDAQVAAVPEASPRRSDRPGRFLALVAAVLCVTFVVQGAGSLLTGEWIAENLGEPYAPHPFREGGLAMIALGVCAAGAAVSRRWSAVSVLTCTPLAIGFGLHGITEVGVFAAGVALHFTEGTFGVLLAVAWWLDRRDTPTTPPEDGA